QGDLLSRSTFGNASLRLRLSEGLRGRDEGAAQLDFDLGEHAPVAAGPQVEDEPCGSVGIAEVAGPAAALAHDARGAGQGGRGGGSGGKGGREVGNDPNAFGHGGISRFVGWVVRRQWPDGSWANTFLGGMVLPGARTEAHRCDLDEGGLVVCGSAAELRLDSSPFVAVLLNQLGRVGLGDLGL